MVCGYHASQAKLAPNAYLTGAEWNWSTAYKTVIDAALTGKPHPNFLRGGLKGGLREDVGIRVRRESDAAKKKADEIKAKMVAGSFDIFAGGSAGLKDNKGAVVVASGKTLKQTDLELEKMNYLVEGVIGSV
jgi:simple sugar transport system substrate-binding protein